MKGFLSTFIAILLLTSCNDIFDTHPYDIDFHSETGINARQIAKIESRFANKDTLRVAFISDTHGWYSDTKDEIADLNKRTDIDFVIHCGDLTDILDWSWKGLGTDLQRIWNGPGTIGLEIQPTEISAR